MHYSKKKTGSHIVKAVSQKCTNTVTEDICNKQQKHLSCTLTCLFVFFFYFILFQAISLMVALFSWQLAISPHPIVLNCCLRRSAAFNKINTSKAAQNENKNKKRIWIAAL